MVSMKDIAATCGVSVATVSKALNDHSDIGEETKQHIKETARKMGYSPNSLARALKTNRTYNIGVLFVDEAQSGLTHDYFSLVLDSFKRTVEDKGYDITFINKGRNHVSYLEHCRYRGFDGVMIACVDFYDPQVVELVHSNIPLVTIDHIFKNRISVMSDNVGGMRQLLEHVYAKGHRRIAYIHGADSAVTRERLASFYQTAKSLGLVIPDEYIKEAPYRDSWEAGERTRELMRLIKPPTCILYPDDFACLGGLNVLSELGLRVPEDVSVVGYDGIRISRHLSPKLTTLKQDTKSIGSKAGERLISLIEHPKSTLIEQVVIKGEVYVGGTVQDLLK